MSAASAAKEEYRARLRQLPDKLSKRLTWDRLVGLLYRCSRAAGCAGEEWEKTIKAIESIHEINNMEQRDCYLRENMYRGWARGNAERFGVSAEEHLAQRNALNKYQEYLGSLKKGWHNNRKRGNTVHKCAEYAGAAGIPLQDVRKEIMRIVENREEIDSKTYSRLVEIIEENYTRMAIQSNPNLTNVEKCKMIFENTSLQKRDNKLYNFISQVINDGNSLEVSIIEIYAAAKPFGYDHSDVVDRVTRMYEAHLCRQQGVKHYNFSEMAVRESVEALIADISEDNSLLGTEVKRDANEPQIVARLRCLGAEVYCVSPAERTSAGYPDLWVVYGGRGIHAEVKTQHGRLNEAQWRFQLHTQVARIRNVNHCDLLLNWLNSDYVELPHALRVTADEVDWR